MKGYESRANQLERAVGPPAERTPGLCAFCAAPEGTEEPGLCARIGCASAWLFMKQLVAVLDSIGTNG